MKKRLIQIAIGLVVILAAAQAIRPDRTNPPVDPARAIQAQAGITPQLVAVLDRACNDCHSNATRWPWYTEIAPLSWIMAGAVKHGRKVVNFSDWTGYSPEQQKGLLAQSCQSAKQGRMPMGAYTALHPEAKLSAPDIETLCAAAQ